MFDVKTFNILIFIKLLKIFMFKLFKDILNTVKQYKKLVGFNNKLF